MSCILDAAKIDWPSSSRERLAIRAHPFRHPAVPRRAGGGFEHDRVCHDGGGDEAGQIGRRHQALFLVNFCHDGGGAADGFVAEIDGIAGLNVREPVVVDDFQNVRLIETRHRLRDLVVVHQDHPFPPRTNQMVTGKGADHFFVFIENRVTPIAVFDDHLLYIVQKIGEMEGDEFFVAANVGDRNGLINETGRFISVEGCGNDAGRRGHIVELLVQGGLAEDDAAHAKLHGAPDHVALLAADNNGVLLGEAQFRADWGRAMVTSPLILSTR